MNILEISKIHQKTKVILNVFPEDLIGEVETIGSKLLNTHPEISVDNSTYSLIAIDILYSCARNFRYIKVNYFEQMICDSLQDTYKLSSKIALKFWEDVFSVLHERNFLFEENPSEDEFLSMIICELYDSDNHSIIAHNLGLGQKITKKIIDVLNLLQTGSQTDAVFLNELEKKVLTIGSEIDANSRTKPWHRELLLINFEIRSLITQLEMPKFSVDDSFLDLCRTIVLESYFPKSWLIQLIEKNLTISEFNNSTDLKRNHKVVELMYSLDLIMNNGAVKNREMISATPKCEQLTARYNCIKHFRPMTHESMVDFPDMWKVAIIRHSHNAIELESILSKNSSLSPDALEAISRKNSQNETKIDPKVFISYLESLAIKSSNGLLRSKSIEILNRTFPDQLDKSKIQNIIAVDSSPAVRHQVQKILQIRNY